MNRKEGILVCGLLITTFFASAFAAPTIQNIMVVGGSSTAQATSVDIEVLKIVPALSNSLAGVTSGLLLAPNGFAGIPNSVSFNAGFSFAPAKGFSTVNRVVLTVIYYGGSGGYDGFSVILNGNPQVVFPTDVIHNTVVGTLPSGNVHVGSNSIVIGLTTASQSMSVNTFLYEVRLTVEYTFLG